MKLLLSLTLDVASVPVEDAGVIRQQILLVRPDVRERLSPDVERRSAAPA